MVSGRVGLCRRWRGRSRWAGMRRDPVAGAYRRTNRWKLLARSVIADHVRVHGWTCPGIPGRHPAHASRDLTADHILRLIDGGEPFERRNLRVLCRGWNAHLNARRRSLVPA